MYVDLLKREPLPNNPSDALDHLRKPLVQLKRRIANSYAGARLAVSYEDLRDKGEVWFGHERWQRHLDAIDSHDPNVEMVIAGFIGKTPLLCRVSRMGGWLDVEPITNFCTIGTGSYTAEPALHAREQAFNLPLDRTLYNVYEAKRTGEMSPSVGKRTTIFVVRAESADDPGVIQIQYVGEVGQKHLDKVFKKHKPKPMLTVPELTQDTLLDAMSIRGRAGLI